MKQSVLLGIAAAAAASAPIFFQPSAKAACIGGPSPCTTFSVASDSTPTDVVVLAASPNPTITGPWIAATVIFTVSNYTSPPAISPFTISNVSLKGDGIISSLNLGNTTNISADGTYNIDAANLGFTPLNSSVSEVNWGNDNTVTFTIPSGLNDGVTISAQIVYSTTGQAGLGSSTLSGNFTTTGTSDVPAPLPLLGAGIAFRFSRNARRRIKAAA